MPRQFIPPFEQHDQEDDAEVYYNRPLRDQNQQLVDENLQLKKLLRENGISWSPSLILNPDNPERGIWSEAVWPSGKKGSRSRISGIKGSRSRLRHVRRLPSLPVEIQLRILEYALTSDYPIIDPLSKINQDALTPEEKKRGNQIAIGFLSTCKAYHTEGTHYLWTNNTFVFTSYVALRNFSSLSFKYRQNIKHITMRIIARYYDNEMRRHSAPYPAEEARSLTIQLPIIERLREPTLARRGFRSYSWLQIVDFLDALRPPFVPDHPREEPRPRLLPGLDSMRMDLVNFPPDFFLSPGGPAIHNMASHDLACTLNELQLTGVPECQWGGDISHQLARMVKDDGLLLKNNSTFVYSRYLRRFSKADKTKWSMRAVRAWKVLADEYIRNSKKTGNPGHHHHHHHHTHRDGPGATAMPSAPKEDGAPPTVWKHRRTLWKRVPINRESEEREWVEFDRTTGFRVPEDHYGDEDKDTYDEDDLVCTHCGVIHSPYDEDY